MDSVSTVGVGSTSVLLLTFLGITSIPGRLGPNSQPLRLLLAMMGDAYRMVLSDRADAE